MSTKFGADRPFSSPATAGVGMTCRLLGTAEQFLTFKASDVDEVPQLVPKLLFGSGVVFLSLGQAGCASVICGVCQSELTACVGQSHAFCPARLNFFNMDVFLNLVFPEFKPLVFYSYYPLPSMQRLYHNTVEHQQQNHEKSHE